jgi:hypothetical protein
VLGNVEGTLQLYDQAGRKEGEEGEREGMKEKGREVVLF